MNKRLRIALATTIMLIACFFAVHMCTVAIEERSTSSLIRENMLLREEIATLQEMHDAYKGILHRVWIDNPEYFEDVLIESDEWCSLMDIMHHDTEDLFEFWDEDDSLDYKRNCHN